MQFTNLVQLIDGGSSNKIFIYSKPVVCQIFFCPAKMTDQSITTRD